MAYGLHSIAHKGYTADGTGRDWFFIGDFEYRNGRKTPTGNHTGGRPTRPPGKVRGEPAEVAFHKRVMAGSGKAKTAARWLKVHQENISGGHPQGDRARSASASGSPYKTTKGDTFVAASWSLGTIPGWKGKRFDLPDGTELEDAGIIRNASAPNLDPNFKAGPGDHTRGFAGASAHFQTDYMKVGNIPGWTGNKFELAHGVELEDAGVIRGPPKNTKKRQEGDHCLGVYGSTPHFKATYHDLGSDFRTPEWGNPVKHNTHATPVFPDVEHKIIASWKTSASGAASGAAPTGTPSKGSRPPSTSPAKASRPPTSSPSKAGAGSEDGGEYRPGDHTRGIRSSKPHFTTTYDSHGQIPGWTKKRYDFGPIAHVNLRLTEWGQSDPDL